MGEKNKPHTSNHHFSCNQVNMSFHILSLDCFSLFIVVAKQGESLGDIFSMMISLAITKS